MKISLLTYHSPGISALAELTDAGKAAYCRRRGYDFHSVEVNRGENEALGWKRLHLIQGMLASGDCDWVYYSGADVLLTNHTVALEGIIDDKADFMYTTDALMLNNDSMLFRNSLSTRLFIETVCKMEAEFLNSQYREQGAMWKMITSEANWATKAVRLPQRSINAYNYANYTHLGEPYTSAKDTDGNDGQWQPGDFAIHFPGMYLEQKISQVQDFLPKVKV